MMAKGLTYGELETLLRAWGFVLERQEPYVLFHHPETDTLVALPPYRHDAWVTEAHLLAVRRALSERGVVPSADVDRALLAVRAS
jgi:hypothetical protein